MWIDIIYIIILAIAILNGYKNGFVGAILSTIGVVIGLAAALKLSVVLVRYLSENTNLDARWLPFIAFILVFLGVMLVVKLISKVIETALSTLMMGWLNKTLGMLLYAFIYTVFYSVAICYFISISKINIVELSTRSFILPVLLELGPWTLDFMSSILPFLKSSFQELQEFFGNWSSEIENLQHQ